MPGMMNDKDLELCGKHSGLKHRKLCPDATYGQPEFLWQCFFGYEVCPPD